jgi:hypothetical protein
MENCDLVIIIFVHPHTDSKYHEQNQVAETFGGVVNKPMQPRNSHLEGVVVAAAGDI